MIEQMAIVIVLLEFNDLGHSVIPTFPETDSLYKYLHQPHCPKMTKNSMGEVKIFFKISVHGTSNPAILWRQSA